MYPCWNACKTNVKFIDINKKGVMAKIPIICHSELFSGNVFFNMFVVNVRKFASNSFIRLKLYQKLLNRCIIHDTKFHPRGASIIDFIGKTVVFQFFLGNPIYRHKMMFWSGILTRFCIPLQNIILCLYLPSFYLLINFLFLSFI